MTSISREAVPTSDVATTGAMASSDAARTPGQATAERVCHDEQVQIWSNEVAGCLSMGNYLRDDLSYDDGISLCRDLQREIRCVVESAFNLAALASPSPAVPEEVRRAVQILGPEGLLLDEDGSRIRARSGEYTTVAVTNWTGGQPYGACRDVGKAIVEVINWTWGLIATTPPSGRAGDGGEQAWGDQFARAVLNDLNPAVPVSAGAVLQRWSQLLEAARPFSAGVYRDNGDVTLNTGHIGMREWLCLDQAVRALAAAPEPAAGGSSDLNGWLEARIEAAHKDSEAHPEGHSNRAFYLGQAIAYENTLSAAEARSILAAEAQTAAGGETLETIAQWCEETFGPITPDRIATRANEEMIELLAESSKVEEAADVVIVLSRYPGLREAIERKMKVNRARRWRFMGDGTGYHIKDVSTSADAGAEGGPA